MDLRMFELRTMRPAGMLIGLLLLLMSAWAIPAAGATPAGLVGVSRQDSVEGDEVVDALAPAATSPANVSDRERRLKKRLLTVAVWGGVVLLLLAVIYGYFRLELTTRGFYSGRLQIVSGIASLAVVTAAYFLWRWLVR